jgi:hypothetical protein
MINKPKSPSIVIETLRELEAQHLEVHIGNQEFKPFIYEKCLYFSIHDIPSTDKELCERVHSLLSESPITSKHSSF